MLDLAQVGAGVVALLVLGVLSGFAAAGGR